MLFQVCGIWNVFHVLLADKFVDILIALLKDEVARSFFSLVVFLVNIGQSHCASQLTRQFLCIFIWGIQCCLVVCVCHFYGVHLII